MIRLKNVSKYYYNKGIIASGFNKINLNFNIGEFVAITGESGSGKSTLLNVISGLDTYEEGEMYINGEQTSHYGKNEFENYRRKYISNIFQNFNLINSYTVYQNIELVLLLNGFKKKDIKKQVLNLIKKVGMYKFRNTKVSKLSGGQKQRVAIARALAKDTPIIIADEPTGSLDSTSAKGIIKILSEISKDKLVIIVTHNYEQVSDYVTRKITMHDGKILEDKVIKEVDNKNINIDNKFKNINFLNKVRLSIRNTFNIKTKFILLMAVYLFITVAILTEYAFFKEQKYLNTIDGNNWVFSNYSEKRIVLNKKDFSLITEEDFNNISKIENIDKIIKEDILLDLYAEFADGENYWTFGRLDNYNNIKSVSIGRLPENENELVIEGSKKNCFSECFDEYLDNYLYLTDNYNGEIIKDSKFKVVGIIYNDNLNNANSIFYVGDKILEKETVKYSKTLNKSRILFMNKYYDSDDYNIQFRIKPSDKVNEGEVIISKDLNYLCRNFNCKNEPLSIEVENIYYNDSKNLKVVNTYNKNNFTSLLGINNYESNNGTIYISYDDYNKLYNHGIYQSSVYVKDSLKINDTLKSLEELNFKTLALKDTLKDSGEKRIISVVSTIVTIILIIVLFFISYFVIKIILKSRNVYFSILRTLGANENVSKQILIQELLLISNIAYFSFIILLILNNYNIINIGFMKTIINYLNFSDFLLLYLIILIMSFFIGLKFSKKLFKKSVITTINEVI